MKEPSRSVSAIQVAQVLGPGRWHLTGHVIEVNGAEAMPASLRSRWFKAELAKIDGLDPSKKYVGIRIDVRVVEPMNRHQAYRFRRAVRRQSELVNQPTGKLHVLKPHERSQEKRISS